MIKGEPLESWNPLEGTNLHQVTSSSPPSPHRLGCTAVDADFCLCIII